MALMKVRKVKDVVILDIIGQLTVGGAAASGPSGSSMLGQKVHDLAEAGTRKIILNLNDVTYVDSAGLGQLVRAHTSACKYGAELKLLNPADPIFAVLRVTKLESVFDIYNKERAAIASFTDKAASAN